MSTGILMRVPGFRTREGWKQVFAVVGYALAVLFVFQLVVDGFVSPPAGVSRVLQNQGFESGSDGWDLAPQASIDNDSGHAHSGKASLKLVATGPWQSATQPVIVTAGQPYDFSGWGRSGSSGGHFTILSYRADGGLDGPPYDLTFPGTSRWEAVSGVYVAPANTVRATIFLQSSAPGSYWFDDVRFAPGGNLVANSGFEAGAYGWQLAKQATVAQADAHSGQRSLTLAATQPWQGTWQSVTVVAGLVYSFGAWGRSMTDGGEAALLFFDTNGREVESPSYFVRTFPGTGEWEPMTGVVVAPANATTVLVYLQSWRSGSFRFDDVTLVSTGNLIDNGSFEWGASGWVVAPQATIDSNASDAHAGKNCLAFVATAPWESAFQPLEVASGQSYALVVWGRSSQQGGLVTIIGFASDGRVIGSPFSLAVPATGKWVAVKGIYVPPNGTVRVNIHLQSSTTGEFWFDDVSMTRV